MVPNHVFAEKARAAKRALPGCSITGDVDRSTAAAGRESILYTAPRESTHLRVQGAATRTLGGAWSVRIYARDSPIPCSSVEGNETTTEPSEDVVGRKTYLSKRSDDAGSKRVYCGHRFVPPSTFPLLLRLYSISYHTITFQETVPTIHDNDTVCGKAYR